MVHIIPPPAPTISRIVICSACSGKHELLITFGSIYAWTSVRTEQREQRLSYDCPRKKDETALQTIDITFTLDENPRYEDAIIDKVIDYPAEEKSAEEPLVILKRRLATGEITAEEFERLRKIIEK